MEQPFFSVVLPVYNVEKYLGRCVESFLRQDFTDYELLLIDDGSTDSSGTLCDRFEEQYFFIKSYHKQNGGLSDARNYGLDRAIGKYILFIDSDDWVDEEMLRFLYYRLKSSKADLIKYAFRRVKNGEYGPPSYSYFQEGLYGPEEIQTKLLPATVGPIELFDYHKNILSSAWINAYSLDFLKDNNIRFVSERIILNEDYLFSINTMLCARSVEITHKVLYYYDFRNGSLSKSFIYDEYARKLNFHKAIKKLLIDYNAWETLRKSYYSQVVDGFYACFTNECSDLNPDRKNAKKNIKKILSSIECQEASEKCESRNLKLKGLLLYSLMKYKMGTLMYYIYKTNQ